MWAVPNLWMNLESTFLSSYEEDSTLDLSGGAGAQVYTQEVWRESHWAEMVRSPIYVYLRTAPFKISSLVILYDVHNV